MKPEPRHVPPPIPASEKSKIGNEDNRLKQTTTKTTLRPRLVCPRWSGHVDEFGGRFDGDISLGNGTQLKMGCFFTAQRHFVVAVYGVGSWRFPAGRRTDADEVFEVLGLQIGDAQNLADFINAQIDDGMDESDHVGTYLKNFCA